MSTLDLASLMPVLPAVLGVLVSFAVELVIKATAPAWLKRSLAVCLSTLAGVLPAVAYDPDHVRTYLGGVLAAWAVAMATHHSGLTGSLQAATAGFGIGPSPAAAVPAGGSPMAAGVVSADDDTTPAPQTAGDAVPPAAPPVLHS